jgi:hypothetical protein
MTGDLRRDGLTTVPGLIDPARAARLLEVADGVRAAYLRCDPVTGQRGFLVSPWSLSYVDHPGLYEGAPGWWFAEMMDLLADPGVRELWHTTTGEEPDFVAAELYMDPPLPHALDRLMQTLAAPDGAGCWHRDVYERMPDDDERAVLLAGGIRRMGSYLVEVALVPSDGFEYVVGSHLRWDTDLELLVRKRATSIADRTQPLPGARRLALGAGDAALVDTNGIHRGWYTHGTPRRTMALWYVSRERLRLHPEERRNRCLLEAGRLDALRPAARAFFERGLALAAEEEP